MKPGLLIVLLGFFYSSGITPMLRPYEASLLFHKIEFVMLSSKPGAAVAFRLRKGQNEKSLKICFRSDCFKVGENWQLLATDSTIPGKQVLVLFDSQMRWTFRKIHLETNMWEQAHEKIVQLRLPSSVVKEIDSRTDQINTEKLNDDRRFSESLDRPWSSQWSLPIDAKVTSEFGALRIPPHGQPYAHTGVDIRASSGTPVHATSDGIVAGIDDEVIFGNVVTIDHGNGLMSRYMHLSSFSVNIGDRVKSGEVIGLSGSTGRAGGTPSPLGNEDSGPAS